MDNSLYSYLLWRKQSAADGDADNNQEDTLSEFGFLRPPPIVPAGRQTMARKIVKKAVKEVLVEEGLSEYYADNYRCWPPPFFLIFIAFTEIAVFIYYAAVSGEVFTVGPVPVDNIWVYRPDRRIEIWRFFTYAFLHAGWLHLVFNLMIQTFVGLPLEMVHGSFRVSVIYLLGVLAGSLGTSVFDQDVYLVGASGGVYALLSAHLANVLLNRCQMELGVLRVIGVLLVASCDVGVAIWDRYAAEPTPLPVSYTAHLMGALSGLCVGLIVLKNFDQRLSATITWWIALAIYSACVLVAVLWNIFIVIPGGAYSS
ncbi:Protein rhomboid [Hypsibius exemplaris]|uniref:rhomboid protease n=1 Tax=Hypsibius exemplaris TaxID=2072580 RepID=A0A9X6NNU8_HYPEX|nr:Protein rhomboid [Hypsibius exemplaris]